MGQRARGQQGYAAPGNSATGALHPSAIRYGHGELWFRPGLDRRRRMLVALASFTVLGSESWLEKFAQSALNVGLKREEIVEAAIRTAPYGGFPRAERPRHPEQGRLNSSPRGRHAGIMPLRGLPLPRPR
jgi:alkylhydroperoxidase/carboxymuconolactone decarboxylase family protein YurZ